MGWASYFEDNLERFRNSLIDFRTHLQSDAYLANKHVHDAHQALSVRVADILGQLESIERRTEAVIGLATNPLFEKALEGLEQAESLKKLEAALVSAKMEKAEAINATIDAKAEYSKMRSKADELAELISAIEKLDRYIVEVARKAKPIVRLRNNTRLNTVFAIQNEELKRKLANTEKALEECRSRNRSAAPKHR